jgi:cell division protein FtsB
MQQQNPQDFSQLDGNTLEALHEDVQGLQGALATLHAEVRTLRQEKADLEYNMTLLTSWNAVITKNYF